MSLTLRFALGRGHTFIRTMAPVLLADTCSGSANELVS